MMALLLLLLALVLGLARAGTWCEHNFQGFKTSGDELKEAVHMDSWDACTQECAKYQRCAWIDWDSVRVFLRAALSP